LGWWRGGGGEADTNDSKKSLYFFPLLIPVPTGNRVEFVTIIDGGMSGLYPTNRQPQI
jgi:hypothetical protein